MKTDTQTMPSKWEIRGTHVAAFFITFFGIIFTVNFVMAGLANRSWTGLIAKNGYVASKDLAIVHRKRRLALAVGWTMDVKVEDGTVMLDIGGIGNEADELSVAVIAERPLNEVEDIDIAMVHGSDGFWRSTTLLPDGRWTLVATMSSGPLELTERLSVEPERRKAQTR